MLAFDKFASDKFAPLRSHDFKFADSKITPERSKDDKLTRLKLAFLNCAFFSIVAANNADERSASLKIALDKFAPRKSTLCKLALLKSLPLKFCFRKSHPSRLIPLKSMLCKSIQLKSVLTIMVFLKEAVRKFTSLSKHFLKEVNSSLVAISFARLKSQWVNSEPVKSAEIKLVPRKLQW